MSRVNSFKISALHYGTWKLAPVMYATKLVKHFIYFNSNLQCNPSSPESYAYIHLLLQGLFENFDDLFVTGGSGGTTLGLAIANYLTGQKLK